MRKSREEKKELGKEKEFEKMKRARKSKERV